MAGRPEYLTVPEVMERLRLGRTTVYEQARLYLATGGAEVLALGAAVAWVVVVVRGVQAASVVGAPSRA